LTKQNYKDPLNITGNQKQGTLFFILGPCVIESRDHTLFLAEEIKKISEELSFPLIFKASFDKANRTSIDSFRGPGMDKGLEILAEVKSCLDLPLLTDIHIPDQAEAVSEFVDIIQIPAFLCRQTDLLVAAGKTGKAVNIKKGQFVSPFDIGHIVEKVKSTGNNSILITERGNSFGYNGLVTDMRSIPIMQKSGCPVIFDATHSAQIPGGNITGGNREYIPHLAKAAIAAGCDGIFMEVHDDPSRAKSDKATQYPISQLKKIIRQLMRIGELIRGFS